LRFIWRLVLMLIRHQAKLRLLTEVKKKGAIAYLRAVNGSRRFLIGALVAFILLQFMVLAGFGALITGFMLWEADHALKLQILFGVFVGLFSVPALFLSFLFSERLWYKASGAEKIIDAVHKSA
jgi:hypothetical protein